MKILETRKLTAGYKKARNVVRDIDIVVEEGKMVGLFGTNGAGKSTILKAVMGMLYQQDGQIFYSPDSKSPVKDISRFGVHERSRMGIKYLTQDARIFPDFTVVENLLFAVDFDKTAFNESLDDITEIFDDFAHQDFLSKKGRFLSGGDREKVAIAMVLLTRPRLLMLDEPSAGLSPNLVENLLKGIRTYQKKQENPMGIILIEQQKLMEAKNACDSVFLAKGGYIIDLVSQLQQVKLNSVALSNEKLEQFILLEGENNEPRP